MGSIKTSSDKKALLLFSIFIILYLLYIRFRLIFSYSPDLDGAEFTFVGLTQQLLRGRHLYTNPLELPFLPVMYTPLYPYILLLFSKLFGFTPNSDPHVIFVLARSLSFLCMLLNMFIIWKIFKQLNFSCAYFLPAITFYLLLITGHFYVARPDAFKITLFSLFLLFAFKYLFFNGRNIYLALAILSGIISVFVKQDAAIHIYLVLATALIFLKSRRTAYLLTYFSASLLAALGLCYLIFGNDFFVSIILFNFQVTTNIFQTFNLWTFLFSLGRTFPFLLLTAYGCYHAMKSFSRKGIEQFIPLIAIVIFIVSHLMMFRAGAYLNYSFESILLVILSSALVIRANENFLTARKKQIYGLAFLYSGFILASNVLIHSYNYDHEKEVGYFNNHQIALQEKTEITEIISDELVFFANPRYGIYFPTANFICGYEMHFDRLVEMLHGVQSSTKLLFVATDNYDAYFTDGKVRYIIAENNSTSKICIEKYYPDFTLFKPFQNLMLYKYEPAKAKNG